MSAEDADLRLTAGRNVRARNSNPVRIKRQLLFIDLERRLKNGEAVRVEGYLERYPELHADRDYLCLLLQDEYRFRLRREPDLTPDEYQRRFPDLTPNLRRYTASINSLTELWVIESLSGPFLWVCGLDKCPPK